MGFLGLELGSRMSGALLALAFAMFASQASAQSTTVPCTNHVTDWSVCVAEQPKECWAATTFKESVNSRNGRVVAVTRTMTLLMVLFRPEAGVKGQIGFTGGYPFAPNSVVTLNIDGTDFELFTEGEWAWPATTSDDSKIITAMKRGSKAVISGRSARGTKTEDTFSLLGFTAAMDEAEKRCS